MATRSGKPYNQETKTPRRRRISIKDTIIDPNHTLSGKDIESNLNVSNVSYRELRVRKSSVKDSTFDKTDISISKIEVGKATESNWIISDMSDKPKRIRSNVNTTNDQSLTSITNGDVENDLNVSNISTKQLRKKKSNKESNTLEKIGKKVDKSLENEKDTVLDKLIPQDTEITTTINKKENKKSSLKNIASLVDEIDQKDTEIDLNSDNISGKQLKKKKKVKSSKKKKQKIKANIPNTTDIADKIIDVTLEKVNGPKDEILDKSNASVNSRNTIETSVDVNTSNDSHKHLRSRKSVVKDNTSEKPDKVLDITFEKDDKKDETFNKSKENNCIVTYNNNTFEKYDSTTFDTFKAGANTRKSSMRDATFDRGNTPMRSITKEELEHDNKILCGSDTKRSSIGRQITEVKEAVAPNLDSTFDKSTSEPRRKSQRLSQAITEHKLNTTFEKETSGTERASKSSLISSDNSVSDKFEISRISITSDDTAEDIINTTPVLIESSMDESQVKKSPKKSPNESVKPQTPLKREGTFTKDGPEVQPQSPRTPGRLGSSIIPAAGCTPYHVAKSSQKKPMLNVTRSIEKRLSVEPAPRMTRVMFCSPVDNPAAMAQEKRKVIKSNLKGSNKSFVFEETASSSRSGRKRSYTHSDAEDRLAKRSRLTGDLQQSVDRLSRPRTTSATAKLTETTPKKVNTPFKSKSESKLGRTRLPNFAALHQKQFDKMESLDECQQRKAKRAKQMLTPTAPITVLDRISPKNYTEPQIPVTKEPAKPKDKTDTPSKKPFSFESVRPGFTRFGFKLNLDVNPFSIPPKTDKPKEKPNGIVPRQGTLPSLTGATSGRQEAAKQTIMREKSFLDKKRTIIRSENRTIIKGVRTNRRFELQMKLRNLD